MVRIPTQIDLRPALPRVLNNVDYHRREAELKRIDEILRASRVERDFERECLDRWLAGRDEAGIAAGQLQRQMARGRRALRSVILVSLLDSHSRAADHSEENSGILDRLEMREQSPAFL